MNRRGFIGALAGAFALVPERALWIPGAKTISIPAPRVRVHNFRRPPRFVVTYYGDRYYEGFFTPDDNLVIVG